MLPWRGGTSVSASLARLPSMMPFLSKVLSSETAWWLCQICMGKTWHLQTYLALSSQYAILVRSWHRKKVRTWYWNVALIARAFTLCCHVWSVNSCHMDLWIVRKLIPWGAGLFSLNRLNFSSVMLSILTFSSCIIEESHQIDQRLVIKLGFTLSLGLCQVLFQACTPLLLFLSANLYFISWVRLPNQVAC